MQLVAVRARPRHAGDLDSRSIRRRASRRSPPMIAWLLDLGRRASRTPTGVLEEVGKSLKGARGTGSRRRCRTPATHLGGVPLIGGGIRAPFDAERRRGLLAQAGQAQRNLVDTAALVIAIGVGVLTRHLVVSEPAASASSARRPRRLAQTRRLEQLARQTPASARTSHARHRRLDETPRRVRDAAEVRGAREARASRADAGVLWNCATREPGSHRHRADRDAHRRCRRRPRGKPPRRGSAPEVAEAGGAQHRRARASSRAGVHR